MQKDTGNKIIAIFEGQQIRRHWDEEKELWYFAVVDVIAALTESDNPQVYWRVLKKRLIDEGSNETVTKCNALKLLAADGKMRLTDVADTKVMLRLIQSIPSPNAVSHSQDGYNIISYSEVPNNPILKNGKYKNCDF